ncbi:MAG: ADP-dependent (S)-NAD(P)H-hydrate dehydratase [Actinomycetota bacterium]
MISQDLKRYLRQPSAADDKYSRGVVGFVTGSEEFPGAAILGVTAAMRTGIGMVRYVGPRTVGELLLKNRPETVLGDGRAQAWVLGSGVPVSTENRASLQSHFEIAELAVVDAGAIEMLDLQSRTGLCVLTPHAGELARLLGISREGVLANPENNATLAAVATGCVVLLKGNTSFIASPDGELREIRDLSPALATAGTGDVLAGIIGALLAANSSVAIENTFLDIIELGVRLHSAAAEQAAIAGPVSAADVAEAVRSVIAELV